MYSVFLPIFLFFPISHRHIICLIGSHLRKLFLSITDLFFVPIKAGQGLQELLLPHWVLSLLPFFLCSSFLSCSTAFLTKKPSFPLSLFFVSFFCVPSNKYQFHREWLRFKLSQCSGSPAGNLKKKDKILTWLC